jgi:hypothetical protein
MRIKNNVFTRFQALTTLLALALFAGSAIAGAPKEPKEFDRLDGRGPSHGKIDVIDWQGNIEIHSYPKGKLAGLGFKLDKKDKNKPVLVISYRFAGVDYKIIRRALDTVGLKEGFKTYRDTTADDYDKIILTNNILNTDVIAFNPDPAPTQLYPDWHESLGGGAEAEDAALAAKDAADGEKLDSTRTPRGSQTSRSDSSAPRHDAPRVRVVSHCVRPLRFPGFLILNPMRRKKSTTLDFFSPTASPISFAVMPVVYIAPHSRRHR